MPCQKGPCTRATGLREVRKSVAPQQGACGNLRKCVAPSKKLSGNPERLFTVAGNFRKIKMCVTNFNFSIRSLLSKIR